MSALLAVSKEKETIIYQVHGGLLTTSDLHTATTELHTCGPGSVVGL